MKLIDQLSNITVNADGSVNFNTTGVFQRYESVSYMLYAYYAHQFLFPAIVGGSAVMKEALDSTYSSLLNSSAPHSDVELNFLDDYKHFLG